MKQESSKKLLQALQEKERRNARVSLIAYTKSVLPVYETSDHHYRIAHKLEAVERGEIPRLIIVMPPRHGKSELASRKFPAWYLGRNPRHQIIASSYSGDLATDFGRSVRNLMDSRDHQNIFPKSGLSPDSQAANRWHTTEGGVYVAAGVGSGITGKGAHILLIDDPIKDHEEAESEIYRRRLWNWYKSTAYTRLMPGGAVIIIQTRWHEDDLVGKLLIDEDGDDWDVLHLKAIDGKQALWPSWYPIQDLEKIQKVIGPREWQALYQGEPTPDEGVQFKREWVRYYDKLPENMRMYGASDYAVTEDDNDYTVHGIVGIDEHDDMYVVEMWRQQTETDKWIEALFHLVQKWKPLVWGEESGQIIKSVGPFIDKRQREDKVYFRREQFTSAVNKVIRARSFEARMSMGKVYFPRNEEWGETLISELIKFPLGKNDDQVDVMSLFGRMISGMIGASVPKPKPRSPDIKDGMTKVTLTDLFKHSDDMRRKERMENYAR